MSQPELNTAQQKSNTTIEQVEETAKQEIIADDDGELDEETLENVAGGEESVTTNPYSRGTVYGK